MSKIDTTYCCAILQQWIQDEKCPVYYNAAWRGYGASAPQSLLKKNEVCKGYRLDFCPACGTQFPTPLDEIWDEILEKEYGLDAPWKDEQKKHIPQEFRTDEWWKKRGLQDQRPLQAPHKDKHHDCKSLDYALEDYPLFFYDAKRGYTISAPEYLLKGKKWPHYHVRFCPWCGGKVS